MQDPKLEAVDDAAALSALLLPVLTRALDSQTGAPLTDLIVRLTGAQRELLILGKHAASFSSSSTANANGEHQHHAAASNSTASAGAHAGASARAGKQKADVSQEGTGYAALLTGMAYLSGTDTWFDLPRMLGVAATQPGRIYPFQHTHPAYHRVRPLLAAMTDTFAR